MLHLALTLVTTLGAAPTPAPGPHHFLILRENGTGSATTAQGFVDGLMVHLARANGWDKADGVYQTDRSAALAYVDASKPEFGLLSLGAFLQLQDKLGLKVVGQADIESGGGLQYHVVSKTATDLAGCTGQSLATNHGNDVAFIDKVVAAGAFHLSQFTVVTTTRPVQTVKKVIRDEAMCALIDDAQLADLAHVEGGAAVHSVWSSKALPPMPVVAFGGVPAAEAKRFSDNLGKVCAGEGAQACAAAGLKALKKSKDSAYKPLLAAYRK